LDAQTWILDASPGYGNQLHLSGAGKGGVSTLVSPRLKQMVTHTGSIMDNKIFWFMLDKVLRDPLALQTFMHQTTPDPDAFYGSRRCLTFQQEVGGSLQAISTWWKIVKTKPIHVGNYFRYMNVPSSLL
jgi:hypothetical protein